LTLQLEIRLGRDLISTHKSVSLVPAVEVLGQRQARAWSRVGSMA